MAGSIKYFVYTDDRGTDWAIKRDESNMESVNNLIQDYPDSGINLNELPRNITPRFARYTSADGRITRNVAVLTSTIFAALPGAVASFTDATSSVVVFLRGLVAEKRRVPYGIDTGLNDGDAS